MHVKLVPHQIFCKTDRQNNIYNIYQMHNGYDTPVTLRLTMQSKHNHKSAGAGFDNMCKQFYII